MFLCWVRRVNVGLWVIMGDPIVEGLGAFIDLPCRDVWRTFTVPEPMEMFRSLFEGEKVSLLVLTISAARLDFFSAGHEEYPIFHNKMFNRV